MNKCCVGWQFGILLYDLLHTMGWNAANYLHVACLTSLGDLQNI
jgi:hypothetical protein